MTDSWTQTLEARHRQATHKLLEALDTIIRYQHSLNPDPRHPVPWTHTRVARIHQQVREAYDLLAGLTKEADLLEEMADL